MKLGLYKINFSITLTLTPTPLKWHLHFEIAKWNVVYEVPISTMSAMYTANLIFIELAILVLFIGVKILKS
jgi:hypothetical protein